MRMLRHVLEAARAAEVVALAEWMGAHVDRSRVGVRSAGPELKPGCVAGP